MWKIISSVRVLSKNLKASLYGRCRCLHGLVIIGLYHAAVIGKCNTHGIHGLVEGAGITIKEQTVHVFV